MFRPEGRIAGGPGTQGRLNPVRVLIQGKKLCGGRRRDESHAVFLLIRPSSRRVRLRKIKNQGGCPARGERNPSGVRVSECRDLAAAGRVRSGMAV